MADAEIVVVGAGMAGATCARLLTDAGRSVLVLEKGRSVGGRLAQRRTPHAVFDHGAQYMAVRDEGLAALVAEWKRAGIVTTWTPRGATARDVERVIGTPAMSAPVKALLSGIEARTGVTVTSIVRDGGVWRVAGEHGTELARAATLVLAIPPLQAAALLGDVPPARRLRQEVVYAPCLSAMVAFTTPLAIERDVLEDRDAELVWAARNGSRPGREAPLDAWTLHASPAWSRAQLEDDPDASARTLLALLEAAVGPLPEIASLQGQRWRYALVERALGEHAIWDPAQGLALCGEWCIAGRIEAAFQSGRAAARAILAGHN